METRVTTGTRRVVVGLVLALLLSLPTAPSRAAAARHYRDFPEVPTSCQPITQQLPFRPCHVTSFGSDRPMVVIWGDSHAQQYLPALRTVARRDHVNLVAIIAGGCPPAIPRPREPGGPYTECEVRQPLALRWIEQARARHRHRFKLVIGTYFAGYRRLYRQLDDPAHRSDYTAYQKRLIRLQHRGTGPLFRELGRVGMPVDVIGQDPTVPDDAPLCPAGDDPYQCPLPRSSALDDEATNRRWITGLMSGLPGRPRLIDTTPAMCDAALCQARVGGHDVYYDDAHLGMHFTRTLGRFFEPTFDDVRAHRDGR